MTIVYRPGASHKNSDALSRRPCERQEEKTACRQCRGTGKKQESRVVRVITRRHLSSTAKLEEKTIRISKCDIDLSLYVIRAAQKGEIYLRTIIDLLDPGTDKPPWVTVEGADLEVQQLYAQWEALQL